MVNNLCYEEYISLYNTDKKELIGVFTSYRGLAKYLFDHEYCTKENALRLSLTRKAKVFCDKLKCMVTFRYATCSQRCLLEDKLYFISSEYPKPLIESTITQEFSSSRLVMATDMIIKNKKLC